MPPWVERHSSRRRRPMGVISQLGIPLMLFALMLPLLSTHYLPHTYCTCVMGRSRYTCSTPMVPTYLGHHPPLTLFFSSFLLALSIVYIERSKK
ncbi:hypothetical protein F4810DRAFT_649060 [Camillea tinctor]|nr:hypothetical protein F4810DRAFT_649060 [Camillea tinctor]